MNILLIEDSKLSIKSSMSDFSSKFPSSSTVYINSRTEMSCLKSLRKRPLLTSKWLVILNPIKMSAGMLKAFLEIDNINILHLESSSRVSNITTILDTLRIDYSVIDNTQINKEDLHFYVCEKLHIKEDLAKYICKRHNYYLPNINNSIDILVKLDIIDKSSINRYTVKSSTISFWKLLVFLVGGCEKIYSSKGRFSNLPTIRKDALYLIYNYRFGIKYLLTYLEKELKFLITLNSHWISGELNLANMSNFLKTSKHLNNHYTLYSLQRALLLLEVVSIDYIYYIYLRICKISKTKAGVIDLLNLTEIGG